MVRTKDLPTSTMDQAIHWWVLLHCESVSAADHREFGEWIALSPERVAAYLHVARLMRGFKSGSVKWPDTSAETLIREAKAATAEVTPLSRIGGRRTSIGDEEPTHPRSLETVSSESRALKGKYWQAAAVALLGAFIVAWYLVLANPVYKTSVGEQRSVLLDDGSRVTLNTNSTVEVRFRNDRRLVRLPKGEALFEVAHDALRPFDVQVGATIFRAIGTQFNVDKRDDHTTVTVVDGKVAVVSRSQLADQRNSPAAAPSEGKPGEGADLPGDDAMVLSAADRMVISTSGTKTLSRLADPSIATAWLKRQLIFDNRPLSEVAEELNRYNRDRIVIEGDELRAQAISGVIQLSDPAAFLSFISGIPGVEIVKGREGVYTVRLDEGSRQAP